MSMQWTSVYPIPKRKSAYLKLTFFHSWKVYLFFINVFALVFFSTNSISSPVDYSGLYYFAKHNTCLQNLKKKRQLCIWDLTWHSPTRILETVRDIALLLCFQSVSSHAGVLLAHNLRGFYLFRLLPFYLFPFSFGFTELLAVIVLHVSVIRVLYNQPLKPKYCRWESLDKCFQPYCLLADWGRE